MADPILTFKTPRQEHEFKTRVHPDIRLLLVEMAQWSRGQQLPAPCVTQIYRSPGEQVAIYLEYWQRLQAQYHRYVMLDADGRAQAIGGHDEALFPNHKTLDLARQLMGLSKQQLAARASVRETLHAYSCAVDLRTKHYAFTEQLAAVKRWVHARTQEKDAKGQPMWAVETNLHGSGPHIHISRLDHVWIEKAKRAAKVQS